MRKIVPILLLLAALAACTSIDCPVQNLVYTNVELKKGMGGDDTLRVDTLWMWTERKDGTNDTVVNGLCDDDATGFSLPISYTQPEDVFYTELRDTSDNVWRDTVRIKKENIPHFESVDCQASYFHEIESVSTTHHGIDSMTIEHSYVDYDITNTHYYLYLKARR